MDYFQPSQQDYTQREIECVNDVTYSHNYVIIIETKSYTFAA